MRYCLVIVVLVAILPGAVTIGQERIDNPFRSAKVGDFVVYKATTSYLGMDFESDVKVSVIAKDEKEATIRYALVEKNDSVPDQEGKIDLTKPYDPVATTLGNKEGKYERIAEGKEKIKVGGKEYDTTWISTKAVYEVDGKTFVREGKA
jgi:hypothetical protein